MPTYSNVDCSEEFGTRREGATTTGGWTAQVVLRVSAANKDDLILDLLTNPPRVYPNIADNPPVAVSAAAVPDWVNSPSDGQGFVYDEYLVTVDYSNEQDVTILSETLQPSAEFRREDHRLFKWASDQAPLIEGEAPGRLIPQMKLIRRNFRRDSIPAVILSPGAVNSAAYVSPVTGLVYPPQTLLLMPEALDIALTTNPAPLFDYSVAFEFKPSGWNTYWRPDIQAYDFITLNDGTSYNAYIPTSFADLLT